MEALILKALVGASVGVVVGLTGIGSGVLLLPILVVGFGVPPMVAVGSDAAFSAFTKVGAGLLHWRQGTVNWGLVRALASGSIPGALCGVLLLNHLRALFGLGINDVLRFVIGVLLVCIPVLTLLPGAAHGALIKVGRLEKQSWLRVSAIGLFAGFLVGISSVGSGTIVLVFLVPLVKCAPSILVGTDIVHAVIVTSFTTLLYLRLGTVDLGLVAALLIGSIPGAVIGARLSASLRGHWLKRVLCITLFAAGLRVLWV